MAHCHPKDRTDAGIAANADGTAHCMRSWRGACGYLRHMKPDLGRLSGPLHIPFSTIVHTCINPA